MTVNSAAASHARPPGPIAYLIPEFPGQTHTWIWREIVHLREWGVDIRLFSTRPPDSQTAARHAFAAEARAETIYLWPRPLASILTAVLWAAVKRRHRLLAAASTVLTLDGVSLRQRAEMVPLLAAACVFAREVATQRIRHVHLHSAARSTVIAMMTRRLTGLPYSIALNANLDWWGGGMTSKLENAEFTAVNANWMLEQVRRDFPRLLPSQVLLARPGVDTRWWTPGGGGAEHSSFDLVTVARLQHGKGHDVAIRAVCRLRRSGRDVRLKIIGGGPERPDFESLASDLEVDDAVEFAGSLSEHDVISRIRAADAFVLASRVEPLGVAYMEAMALGLPTIGTTTGGVGEVITHDHDGLLVPPGDEERLAQAIARLMDDPALRTRLGANGRQTILERFDSRIGASALYERFFGFPPPSRSPGGV